MCLDFIHLCFSTVAEKFGLTRENCPGHNAFMPMEKLENFNPSILQLFNISWSSMVYI